MPPVQCGCELYRAVSDLMCREAGRVLAWAVDRACAAGRERRRRRRRANGSLLPLAARHLLLTSAPVIGWWASRGAHACAWAERAAAPVRRGGGRQGSACRPPVGPPLACSPSLPVTPPSHPPKSPKDDMEAAELAPTALLSLPDDLLVLIASRLTLPERRGGQPRLGGHGWGAAACRRRRRLQPSPACSQP